MNTWLVTMGFWLSSVVLAFGLNTKARLVLAADTVRPGDTVLAGVLLEMNPGWHTYWRNPGESGMATEIEWNLPDGVKAGPIQWPAPDYYDSDGLVTYVLHDQAVLLVPLTFSAELPPGRLQIKAEVSWLECEVQCVPGAAGVQATVVIGSEKRPSAAAPLLAHAESELPRDGTALDAVAGWQGPAEGDERALLIEWPATGATRRVQFFPYTAGGYEIRPQVESLPVDDSRVALRAVVKKIEGTWPTEIAGVIILGRGTNLESFEVRLKIDDAELETPTSAAGSPRPSQGGLALHLLLALGGGLILNLMPCVLPILSLKVLSLVRQRGSSAGERRRHGLVYTLGVLVSFWAIGALVIAGRLASWGEQFQDPRFIVALTVLMTLVALNLFGVFEVILPGSAVTSATQLASREGAGGAFFNGVLAVVLGASCVAPLLAGAVGWAIAKPPLVIFLIFSMIGFGLALPFLLLSFFPSLQRLLPKPGAWMEKFKVAMGFPMLATAAWLLSQTADHFGAAGPLWLGLFLVLLALALWIYGEFIQRGGKRKRLALVFVLLFAVGGYVYALERELDWRHPPQNLPGQGVAKDGRNPEDIPWQPWSPGAVAKARMEGRPVLVDFTANWCLTCKLNKRTSLEIGPVNEKLRSINAVALKGDYTRKDPAITAELKRFERFGVPLVLVYPKDPTQPPVILPTLLTPGIVLDALEAAAR
jgi:thiol:disulfide interchange protein DsbD